MQLSTLITVVALARVASLVAIAFLVAIATLVQTASLVMTASLISGVSLARAATFCICVVLGRAASLVRVAVLASIAVLAGIADFMQTANLMTVVSSIRTDDLIEFEGAIQDEGGCFDGGTVYFNRSGVIFPADDKRLEDCSQITALFCEGQDESGTPATWAYETDIPHETFKIWEDGDLYCIGMVFSIEDVNGRCAYLEPAKADNTQSATAPVLRETMRINVGGVMTTVYKDEIEREIYKALREPFMLN